MHTCFMRRGREKKLLSVMVLGHLSFNRGKKKNYTADLCGLIGKNQSLAAHRSECEN